MRSPAASLHEILEAAGLDGSIGGGARIEGSDPVLPTPYRIGTAAAASLAATGLAAARLWQARGGHAQAVSVDARAAAASLRSATYLRVDGNRLPPPWDPLSGFYPVQDGWISIHCNFANHRQAAYRVLDCEEDRNAGEASSARWKGEALEDAIHAAAGCAGFVRAEADWLRHRQARAVAAQPLLSIERIGDAPREPLAPADRPLSGVRVADLTRVLAGPTCAKTLAAHGADVLKVSGAHLPHSGLVELDTGIGKLSTFLDLGTEEGISTLAGLVKDCDVFSQSYRPGALADRGFSPEVLATLRPGIVYVSLSAWGATGPWAERRGFDSIVQAVSGMAALQGRGAADGRPKLLPVSAIDYVSGYLMAFGAMAALERRAREGGTWHVRVGLARVGKWIVERGLEADGAWRQAPADLGQDELAPLMQETDAPDGRIRHLGPVVRLAATPPRWTRPPVPLGVHPAAWPPRRKERMEGTAE
jgi:crotonobetainyl-CoA:carnitine CoA-transferase CaiB-like acyl-CoA transferase